LCEELHKLEGTLGPSAKTFDQVLEEIRYSADRIQETVGRRAR
jgi:hypothetical protein